MSLHRALKTLERAQCSGHGLRRNQSGLENAGAEARNLAILRYGLELMSDYPGDLETAGIGADVDCSECWHVKRAYSVKIHDAGG